ncbi:helicase [Corynebacterium striatum]|uniref:Helicase n=1 Tax=Corynebacterium striatum TaxID=43770 RepID=A0ABC9ZN11_CORST|nr:DEAD/DEAH box helicase [Corynebacterium striatum]EEI78532.1 DEAD/DEAH box helicase [Corynebacterium striatum ATCC 6940]GEA43550.1 helicase [Corynebacterium striatum]GEA44448.1 helicase [Corynebacterium striatum]STD62323.1 helicase [Corynebacterium striatum]
MNLSQMLPDLAEVPESLVDEAIWDTFLTWTNQRGISLYPAQEEASLGILAGDNVILATPTGSGKSMVANAAHFIALARGQRSFYTAPIKALVSEKFFALCEIFGAENVGMMTGDATVNGNAPIIAATAEIVANIALRDGAEANIDQVVMDEFHYYSEPDRGWAWQVPLLELPKTQFLLMSATLGDTSWLEKDLTERTGRETTLVAGSTRPVPLDFSYVFTAVHETIEEILKSGKAPVYVVHFSQREASERAQALTSLSGIITPEEKEAIAAELSSFRFTTTFGRDLSKLLRRGIGVHHAGMLPKYRRLVERLAQKGLLKIICGTDTLGVGINVPIRTVLMTGLAKYDGQRQRILKSREFHQIAGRAGRAGYDTEGTVIVEAPEHEIENAKARRRLSNDPARLKKLKKKSAREGDVTWSEKTFARLTEAEPEQLTSQFRVSNSMLLNVLARHGNGYEHMKHLLRTNHDTRTKQNQDILTALDLFRGLLNSGVVQKSTKGLDIYGRPYHLVRELPRDFALNQPLGPFALAALSLLDPESDTYTLDVISVYEAILDDPRQVLIAQQKQRRGEEIAALKADGVDYTERMAIVEEITWPKPLEELLEHAYDTFAETNAWVKEFELRPKSVVRDMLENAMTFSDLVATYGLARSEGVILRYLTDAWRTLKQSVPDDYFTEELSDVVVWLGELIRQVDSSLVDEWAEVAGEDSPISQEDLERELAFGVEDPTALTSNRRAFSIMVRNYMFRLVQLFALEKEERLAELLDYLEEIPDFGAALDDYFDEYDDIDSGPAARGPEFFRLSGQDTRLWQIRQIIKDPEGDHGYQFVAVVDLDASDEAGEVRLSSLIIER